MAYKTGPKLVTDGLVFLVDSADKNSYAGSGTTWTDLTGNGHDMTFTNGPSATADGKAVNFARADSEYGQLDDATAFSNANGGKAFYTGVDNLGEMIFEDYENNRKRKI